MRIILLAAGESKRFREGYHKLTYPVLGRALFSWSLERALRADPEKVYIVRHPSFTWMDEYISDERVEYVEQTDRLGTGHAVQLACEKLGRYEGPVLVVNGDMPAIRSKTFRALFNTHRRNQALFTITTGFLQSRGQYGRIVRKHDSVQAIIEYAEDDAVLNMGQPVEVNLGLYAFEWPAIRPYLYQLQLHEQKGEYYLTDLVEILRRNDLDVGVFLLERPDEALGVNTWEELHIVEQVLRKQVIEDHIQNGVRIFDPKSVWIEANVRIEGGCILYGRVWLSGQTRIGKGTIIYPGVRIDDSTIGEQCEIFDYSLIESSIIHDDVKIGPFARIRPGCEIGSRAKVGNFVEMKKTHFGEGSKAMHLSYLGDATIGAHVNIGAGTITCNYDGVQKHQTIIEDGVFIGSDTQLVAPVTIHKEAYIGAGSTITKDVPSHALALTRVPQKNVEGWVLKRREKQNRAAASRDEKSTKE